MIEFEIETKSKSGTVVGPKKFRLKTIQELEDFVIGNHILLEREFLKNEQSKGEFPSKKEDYITITDGSIGKHPDKVKLFGKTERITKLDSLIPVIRDAMRLVIERSATSTGYYQFHNVLVYNGKIVAKGLIGANQWLANPPEFKTTDKIRVMNISPYARKLERYGIKRGTAGKRKGLSNNKKREGKNKAGADVLFPNGAYVLAQRVLRNRYKSLKNNIRFSFIPLDPSIARQWNSGGKDTTGYVFKKGTRSGAGVGRPYLYPSISITIAPESFTQNAGFTESGGNL